MKSHTLGVTASILSLMAFCAAPWARADDFGFVGSTTVLPGYGGHPTITEETPPAPPCFTEDLTGSFGDASEWQALNQPFDPTRGIFTTTGPGPGDSVGIGGAPEGTLSPVEGPSDNSAPNDPVYGYYNSGGFAGYTNTSFNVSGVGGTVANFSVAGPGTLSLGSLTATDSASFVSTGGQGVATWVPGVETNGQIQILSLANSIENITGGSLSTASLTLNAGTNLNEPVPGLVVDPVADAGSLIINGATLSGDTTQVVGVPAGSTLAYEAQPVTLTGATLNAKTELDIVGVDPSVFPLAVGTTTLSAGSGSTITAGAVVIATGATGYGSGSSGVPAELDLDGSTLTANNPVDTPPSLVVGDTGDGVLSVTDGSTVNAQQSVIGNAADATGNVTIDGSTWKNASFMTIGNYGQGTLNVQNSATVTSSDVIYVGLNSSMGTLNISDGATVTTSTTGINGPNSLVVGTDADSTGYISIVDAGSQLESTGDTQIGYDGNGTASISGGGALIVDGTLFRVGRDEGSTGSLTVSGSGSSVMASNATLYVGYGGTGEVDDFDGASLTVMATNIGGQSTGDGTLNIDGMGTQATLGDVTVGDAGNGMLTITGGATVNTGDITIGAQSDESDAAINAAPIANTGYMLVDGTNTQVMANGDMIVGDQDVGFIEAGDGAMLAMHTLTVGNGGTGNGQFNVVTGATATVANDATVAAEEDSQGNIDVDGTGTALTITGDLTVGGGGTGMLTVSGNSTVTNQGAVVGNDDTSTGTVEVTGTGSIWHSRGDVTIGENGTGTVTVEAGGALQVDVDLTLGLNEDSQGTLVFDGAMTKATFGGGDVTIGSSGTGTMTVQNGAFVDLAGNAVTLGDQDTGNGTLTVTDTSSILNTGDLTVGGTGTGSLTVQNTGTLSSGSVTIGDMEDSNGTATVTDGGSTWTATGLTVGSEGTGTLDIENGGVVTVNSTELSIGDEDTGDGTITLSDMGSQLSFTGELQVGEKGTGLFAVQGGASFTGKSIVVGDMPDSIGGMNVDGVGTTATVQTDFNIGEQGTGTLNVSHNAKLMSNGDATLADKVGSSGTATVDTLASWSVAGTLTVGGQSNGTLTIQGGGNVTSNNITIADQSSSTNSILTVTGVSPSSQEQAGIASELQFSGVLAVGNSGNGTLNITAGASVDSFSIPNPPTPNQQVDVGVKQGGTGNLNISGDSSSLIAQSLIVGDSGTGTVTQGDGTIVQITGDISLGNGSTGQGTYNENGGSVSADSLHDGTNVSFNAHGYYNLANDASLNITGFEYVGYNGLGSFNQSGTSTNTVGQTLDIATYPDSKGTYSLSGGTLTASAIAVNYDGRLQISGGSASSTNPIGVYNDGVISVNGGTLNAPSLVNSINGAPINFLSTAQYVVSVPEGTLTPEIDLQIPNTYAAQIADGYCGDACMEMVFNSPAVAQKTAVSQTQQELFERAFSADSPFNTSPSAMANTLSALDPNHLYSTVVMQNGDTVSRAIAESLMTTNVPASILVTSGEHWIDVYGVSTIDVAAANEPYTINGFYVKDPWFGFAQANPKPNQAIGIALDTFLAYNDRAWFSVFNVDAVGVQAGSYVAVVGEAVPQLPFDSAPLRLQPPPNLLPTDLTLSGAIEDGEVDLADDPALADEYGFTGGAFNTNDAFFVSLPTDTDGEGDWVIPYEGTGGADDVTGVIAIDADTGNLDEANWIESGQDPMLLFQLQAAYDDQFAGDLPNDNIASVPEPTVLALLCGIGLLVSRRRRSPAA